MLKESKVEHRLFWLPSLRLTFHCKRYRLQCIFNIILCSVKTTYPPGKNFIYSQICLFDNELSESIQQWKLYLWKSIVSLIVKLSPVGVVKIFCWQTLLVWSRNIHINCYSPLRTFNFGSYSGWLFELSNPIDWAKHLSISVKPSQPVSFCKSGELSYVSCIRWTILAKSQRTQFWVYCPSLLIAL